MSKKRETLAAFLLRTRKAMDWSQAMTAHVAGVPLPTYRKWEQGVCSPGAAEFLRACRELGIDCGELADVA